MPGGGGPLEWHGLAGLFSAPGCPGLSPLMQSPRACPSRASEAGDLLEVVQTHVESGSVLFCFSSWQKSGGDRPGAAAREPWPLGFRARDHLSPGEGRHVFTVPLSARGTPLAARGEPGARSVRTAGPGLAAGREAQARGETAASGYSDSPLVGQGPPGTMTAPWPLARSLAEGKEVFSGLFPPKACTASRARTWCGREGDARLVQVHILERLGRGGREKQCVCRNRPAGARKGSAVSSTQRACLWEHPL